MAREGGRTGVCLLSSSLLSRTKHVKYLMAPWCIYFTRVLVLVSEILRLVSFSEGVFVYSSCYPACDGDEGVYFPFIVLYCAN